MTHHRTYIAGIKFHPDGEALLAELNDDARFDLEPEPDNKFDPNAVKVLHGGTHVGYVPKDLAPEIGGLIAKGRLSKCCFRDGNSAGHAIEIHYQEEEPSP